MTKTVETADFMDDFFERRAEYILDVHGFVNKARSDIRIAMSKKHPDMPEHVISCLVDVGLTEYFNRGK